MTSEVQELVDWLATLRIGGEPTPERRRLHFETIAGNAPPLPADQHVVEEALSGISTLRTSVSGTRDDRIILFFHGGGFGVGSARTHLELAGRIARSAQARVFLPDYRLAPEHPYPAALQDAVGAYLGLLGLGYQPQQICIGGDSAGGGLALSALIALRDFGEQLPACAILISPWVDLTLTASSLDENARHDPLVQRHTAAQSVRRYIGESGNAADPQVSPLFADLSSLCPLLIQVGLAESLLDDSRRLAQRAESAGVKVTLQCYPDMIHIFPFFAHRLSAGQQAIEEIGAYLKHAMPSTKVQA